MNDVHERLRKLLFLVPYVVKHQGISVDQLAKALETTRASLLKDLDLLTLVGRPPFQPDDYIDIEVENDRIRVNLDQRFSAPPRLTAAEAAALASAAKWLAPVTGSTLDQAVAKLEKVIPPALKSRYREMDQAIDTRESVPSDLSTLHQAVADRREVEFDYFSQGRGATECRVVKPFQLLNHRGQWYLSAYCCSRLDNRLFRLDRIQALSVSNRTFPLQSKPEVHLPNPAGDEKEVRVQFTSKVAAAVRERFTSQVRASASGGVEVTVTGDSERWLVQWILSFGGEAQVVEPDWARKAVAEAARQSVSS